MISFQKAIGYSRDLETKDKFAYIIAGFTISILTPFLAIYILIIKSAILTLSALFFFLLLLTVILLLKNRGYFAAKILLCTAILLQEMLLVFLWFSPDANLKYFFFIIVPISFLIFNSEREKERQGIVFFSALSTILICINEFVQISQPKITTTPSLNLLISVMSVISSIGATAAVLYMYEKNISRQHRKLDLLAQTDGLTGIYNRRALIAMGKSLFQQPLDGKNGFALLIFDLDHFKNVNDTFGHSAGDVVLQEMTKRLSENIREKDFLSRYGGEEFALILLDIDPDAAAVVAEDLRCKVEKQAIMWGTEPISITTSIGLSHRDFHPADFDDLLRQSDAALYRAKDKGRNRVEVSSSRA
ncbi:MAG: GGDEF domain-containing protein [Spirochaetales bacterium]|nr:GGDEF domain-containing protein [Spirochaetales bacterium]